jgi:phage-related protein
MSRRISWVKAAFKDFAEFPPALQDQVMVALRIAARGEKADVAKPMKGLGSGVFEIALRHRGDAFRAVYAVQIDDDVWVLHAFQKKSKTGIKTPKHDMDLIRERMRRVKERL